MPRRSRPRRQGPVRSRAARNREILSAWQSSCDERPSHRSAPLLGAPKPGVFGTGAQSRFSLISNAANRPREMGMTVQLDHTIVPSRNKVAAAKLLAELLGVPWAATGAGPFAPVYV